MVAPTVPASALQLTEFSDATCTTDLVTEIVASYGFLGCSNGVQVKTLPASTINPCLYFRDIFGVGYTSAMTGDLALPLVPGTWNVTSHYPTSPSCAGYPLVCSALLGTDPGQVCDQGKNTCSVRSRKGSALHDM